MEKWDYQLSYALDNKQDQIPSELYGDRRFISTKTVIRPLQIPACLSGLGITLDHLDVRGDIDFNQNQPPDVRIRGGLEYYKPILGKGYGLNIGENVKLFQKWAVCFHGVKSPENIQHILREGLKPGPGQAFMNKKDVCGEQQVPKGVYVTPWMNSAFGYVNQARIMILQCLVDPKAIVMADRKDYWIIKGTQSLVPYRIIHVEKMPKNIQF